MVATSLAWSVWCFAFRHREIEIGGGRDAYLARYSHRCHIDLPSSARAYRRHLCPHLLTCRGGAQSAEDRCVSAQVGNDRVERSGEAAPPLACGWNHDSPMLDPCRTKRQKHTNEGNSGLPADQFLDPGSGSAIEPRESHTRKQTYPFPTHRTDGQSVKQSVISPPRSPRHRLSIRLRRSRSTTSTEYSLPGATQLSQVRSVSPPVSQRTGGSLDPSCRFLPCTARAGLC